MTRFTAGENYSFRISFGPDTRNLTWKTKSVSGDQVTADITYETSDGQIKSETITGTQEDITKQISDYPTTAFDVSRRLHTAIMGHQLKQGNTWTMTTEDDSVTTDFEVIGSDTVNGVPCTVVRSQDQGKQRYWELCINENHPFLFSAVQFSQSGDVRAKINITGYS